MIGNINLGVLSLGTAGAPLDDSLNYSSIFITGLDVDYVYGKRVEVETAIIDIDDKDADFIMRINMYPNSSEIQIVGKDSEKHLIYKVEPNLSVIDIYGFPVQITVSKHTPTIEQYIEHINTNIRRPIYKIELLRKEDETVRKEISGDVINNSGGITNSLEEGVRRTCNFTLQNYNNEYGEFVNNLSIGDKFKVYLGYNIDGKDKFFPQGVYVFDDPTIVSERSRREVELSGTDKWSMLNGENGGVLEGTYVIPKGTKIGDLIRKTLRLNIVNDPIDPAIHPDIDNMTTTYDITKNAGETVSDIFLEAALNVSAYIYYDENGRMQVYPVENDMYKAPAHKFSKEEYNYLSGSKQYELNKIFNSILVIGDNIKNSNTPIIYEALNNDLSDPNSIPNVGFKKVKKITEHVKGIDTMEKAKARGNWELKKAMAKMSNLSIECLSLYHLDVNQVIILDDYYLNSKDERFVINSIDLPIGSDMQSTITLAKGGGLLMGNQTREDYEVISNIVRNTFNQIAREEGLLAHEVVVVKSYNTTTKMATVAFPSDLNTVSTEYKNLTNGNLTVGQKAYLFHRYGDTEQGWILAV